MEVNLSEISYIIHLFLRGQALTEVWSHANLAQPQSNPSIVLSYSVLLLYHRVISRSGHDFDKDGYDNNGFEYF